MKKLSLLFIGIFILPASCVFANLNPQVKELINFLVSKELLISSKDSKSAPLSYYIGAQEDIDKYFGDYICAPTSTCHITISLYKDPYALLGKGLPPQQGSQLEQLQAQAQIERMDMKYGTDIYDAATWQIALGLAAHNNYIANEKAQALVANQLESISHLNNRATDKSFKYGYMQPIANPKNAFSYRMIATNFHNKDPFYQGKYREYIDWDFDPEELTKNDKTHSSDYYTYSSTWSDWKPITGENAWAQLIGPLQADYLLNKGIIKSNSPALINAINSLYAFSAMQAGIGAFYYAPGGSQGNQGPIEEGEISIENNFSVLGGLQILKQILEHTDKTPEIQQALKQVNTMLYGGITVNQFYTVGLLSFLYNGAYDTQNGLFYTHGIAPSPSSTTDWNPDTSGSPKAMAVDVNTWGISALGVETIDNWYGQGSALKIWNNIRDKGGYYNQNQLWGVGYTLNNNTNDNPERIMSTEWTAGAINTLNSLITYYDSQGIDTSELKKDLASMKEGITHLRNDLYLNSNFDDATPKDYFVKVPPSAGQAYLYASKRFPIPFGWNANTLVSTTSNAWVIMNHFNYNPFQYEGKLLGEHYAVPKKINLFKD